LPPAKLTVDRALEIDRHLVAICCSTVHRGIFHLLFAQPLDHRIDIAFRDFGRHAIDFE